MMMAAATSWHCEDAAGLAPDCCKVDDQTARQRVVQAIAPAPGKPVLAPLPANAQPELEGRSASGRSFWAPPLEPPLDSSHLRSVVLLI